MPSPTKTVVPDDGMRENADGVAGQHFRLVRSFLLAAGVVVTVGMGTIGLWVSERIEAAVSENAATVAALYVDSIVAPLTQDLQRSFPFDPAMQSALDERLDRGLMNQDLFAFKIWRPDGVIAYASDRSLVGQRFERTPGLIAAAEGRVHTEYHQLGDAENSSERARGVPLLEIYSPIRDAGTGQVVGVVEFYDRATGLEEELREARQETWLVVGAMTAGMLAVLSIVIVRGGRVIDAQRSALGAQVGTLSHLLAQNRSLTERVDQANRRAATLNERHLRRISAEIHDGPVQLLAYASLRLDTRQRDLSSEDRLPIRQAVDEAIGELRQISRGLTLPELDGLSAADVARRAVKAHERTTGRQAALNLEAALPEVSQAERICLYRVLQEGLNNAERHAKGAGVMVDVSHAAETLVVRVRDAGPGFDPAVPSDGLGLSGLRERLAGLGGELVVLSTPGVGTVLEARLPIGHQA